MHAADYRTTFTTRVRPGPFTAQTATDLGIRRHRAARSSCRRLHPTCGAGCVCRERHARARWRHEAGGGPVISTAVVLCNRSPPGFMMSTYSGSPKHDVIPTLDTYVLPDHIRADGRVSPAASAISPHPDIVDEVRVTSPCEALDLGCALSRRDALRALDTFMRPYDLSREQTSSARCLAASEGAALVSSGALSGSRTRAPSRRVSRGFLEIIDNLFPPPVLQWSVRRDGSDVPLDLAYPGLKIAIEYDGEEFRDSSWLARPTRGGWLAGDPLDRDRRDEGQLSSRPDLHWTEELRRAMGARRCRPGCGRFGYSSLNRGRGGRIQPAGGPHSTGPQGRRLNGPEINEPGGHAQQATRPHSTGEPGGGVRREDSGEDLLLVRAGDEQLAER